MRITKFLRTTAFRLALIYAGIFSLSVILLFAFIFWTTSVLVDRQRQQAVLADMNDLRDEFASLGLPGLLDSVIDRSRPDRVGNGVYLLTNPDYVPMAGNLSAWPKEPNRQGQWITFSIEARRFGDQEGERSIAQAIEAQLPGGYHVMVGQNTAPQRRMPGEPASHARPGRAQ